MVNTSLFTGLSGLRAHQQYLDVIGNNIANVNTPGFWGSRVTFSDLLSFTMSGGSGPHGELGGRNPLQVGLGTNVASIDLNTNQGTFLDTGRPLDVAIQGKGFFTLSDGNRNFYTRVGSFGVDTNRRLVDLRTGLRVMDIDGNEITVPASDTIPARATSTVTLEGNLPAKVTGPLAEILSSGSPFQAGTAASLSGGTGPFNLSSYNGTKFSVSVDGGTPQTVTIDTSTFTNPAAVTATEIKTMIESQVTGVTVQVSGNSFTLETNHVGSSASLKLENVSGTPLSALGLSTRFTSGTQTAATASTSLNQLVGNQEDYQAGDRIVISGQDAAGHSIGDTFVFGTGAGQNGTTLGDLVTFLDNLFPDADVTLDSDGTLKVTASETGESKLALHISDHSSNTGSSTFPSFKVTQEGKGPDTVTTSMDIYDSLGRAHPVTFTFTRTSGREWSLTATVPEDQGSAVDGSVDRILFNEDGSFNVAIDGNGTTLTFSWDGLSTTQTINLSLGSSAQFDGLTQMGEKSSAAATDQDGYPSGDLLNVSFESNGVLQGFYSNGHTRDLATLRVAIFTNEGGLLKEGDTLFSQSPNSDDPIITQPGTGGAGTVVSGVLENSNVDIAEEFVRLIEAQRGYQANARVITTTDQILAELVNLVR